MAGSERTVGRRICLVALAVTAGHVAVIALWHGNQAWPVRQKAPSTRAMVLLETAPVAAPETSQPAISKSDSRVGQVARAQARALPAPRRTATTLGQPQELVEAPTMALPPTVMDEGAKRPHPLRLDDETIRKAIAHGGSSTHPIGLPALIQREPVRSGIDAALQTSIAASAHGDCERGQYAGSGMGLLSAPFLAVAALQGRCAK